MKTLYFEYFVPQLQGEVCEERHHEILVAIQHNLADPQVDRVVVFANEPIGLSAFQDVEILVLPATRMTFQEIFDYANETTGPGDIHILCNTDIAIIRGFDTLEQALSPDDFLCVSRYEGNGIINEHAYGSQDVWVWRGHNRIRGANFHLGIRGCDCHLIGMARRFHYQVTNPSKDLISVHCHESNLRNAKYNERIIPGPWFGVEPSALGVLGEVCHFKSTDNCPVIRPSGGMSRSALRMACAKAFG